ncbi:MAG TPA: homoserine O-acetyltransferase [Chthonomonadales bacterium]|nr:homoserine O-acetyltransferase [Chthonomonadales bacterium]
MAEAILSTSAQNSVGIVERKMWSFASQEEPFVLENGQALPRVDVCYETYGELNASGTNCVLVVHGLTGSSHAAGRYQPDSKYAGYWDPLIGPGKVLDTDHLFVVAPNVLGGCRGSTGPSSIDPRTGKPYGLSFPIVTVRDMVRVQRRLLRHLGVQRVHLVVGGSMGGMQALDWAVTYPDMVEATCPIASCARSTAQIIAFNECMRRAIMLDPGWKKGAYYGEAGPRDGLALARMIGTITYLSDPIMQSMFARKPAMEKSSIEHDLHARFDVERYLHDEGEKLVRRFDANSYLYISRAIDLHDISRGHGSLGAAYERIRARVLLIGIRSDILFYPHHIQEMHRRLTALGIDSAYWEMDSEYGHDAFLVEQEKMIEPLRGFLERVGAPAA